MVEFALVFPLLIILILGVIEVGHLMFTYSMVFTAVREASRYGSAAGETSGNTPRYMDCAGIREAAKRTGSLAGVDDGSISIQYDHGPSSSIFSTSCPPAQPVQLGDRILVRVTTQYQPIIPIIDIPPVPITSSATRTILKDITLEGTPLPASP